MPDPFDSILYKYVYCTLSSTDDVACVGSGLFGGGLLPGGLEWLAYVLTAVTIVAVLINAILGGVLLMIWGERRLLGRFQGRTGPNRWGPFGLLTPIADAVKTMFKEDVMPTVSDRLVFTAAPILMLFPALLIYAVLPFGAGTWLADINVALLFIIAIGGANVLAIVAAALGSGNRYAMFSAMRSVAMLISYEIPLVISLIGVLMLSGSLSLVAIVNAQTLPFFIVQPLGFFVFLVASMAELNRTPFDVAEAESEIVAGYMTDYSSMKFGLFFLSEFAATIATSGVITAVFLGGWHGFDPIPSQIWFIGKMVAVLAVIVWIRASWPRLRIDQIMNFAWKALFELTLINLVVSGILVLIWPSPSTTELWYMAGINWVVFLASIYIFGKVLGPKHDPVKAGNIQPDVTLSDSDAPALPTGGGD